MDKKKIIKAIQAEANIEKQIAQLKDKLWDLRGETDNLLPPNAERTNIYCTDAPDSNHIYVPDKPGFVRHGLGHRKCIFCGLDDFDLY